MRRARCSAIIQFLFLLALSIVCAPDAVGDEAGGGTVAASGAQSAGATTNHAADSAGGQAQTAPAPAASPSPSPTAQELPTIVVTATRLEQPLSQVGTTVTVISHHSIESQQIDQVNDALRQVPGVELTQSGSPGSISDVFIRGASPAQTLVLLDGVEVNTGATGSFDLANLTTDDLDRIEVVRGAGGALYGSQAVGGVINFLTREGQGPLHFSLLSEGGNRATERQALSFGGSEGRLGCSGAISYFSTTGFRPVNDSHDNLSGTLRLDYHLDADTRLRGFARYIRSGLGLVNFSNFTEPVDPDAHQRNEFMLFKGEIERRLGDRLTARIDASFVRNDLRLFDLPDPGNQTSDVSHIPDETRATNAEITYAWAKGFRSLVGFDFKDRWMRTGCDGSSCFPQPITVFHAGRQEYAGYVEQEGSLFDGFLLGTAGFRADGNSDFGQEVSPAWAVAIPLSQAGATLRGSYSEGFRAPSFNDLFFPGFGNRNLGPELSSEYDGGFSKRFGEMASFDVTYFSRRVHGLIETAACGLGPGCPFGLRSANLGRVDVQGVELVPAIRLQPGLSLSGNFTVLDETHAASASKPLRVPKRSASGLLQYVSKELVGPHDELTLSLGYTFVGDRDDIDNFTFATRSHVAYHRFDAAISYDPGFRTSLIRGESVFARVQNLLDRNYSEAFGFKAPPINGVAGVKLDF